jgi:hypothetical protein
VPAAAFEHFRSIVTVPPVESAAGVGNQSGTNSIGNMLAGLKNEIDKTDPFDFHVGVITAFNNDTGANTVYVRGANIPNIPMLNSSSTVTLGVGDNVVVLKYRTGYFILGRIISSNSTSFGSEATDFDGYVYSANNVSISTTLTTKVSQIFVVPTWASGALVNATVHFNMQNNSAVQSLFYTRVTGLIGNTGALDFSSATMFCDVDNTFFGYTASTFSQAVTVFPGEKITISGQVSADVASAADSFNRCYLTTMLVYRRSGQHGIPGLFP